MQETGNISHFLFFLKHLGCLEGFLYVSGSVPWVFLTADFGHRDPHISALPWFVSSTALGFSLTHDLNQLTVQLMNVTFLHRKAPKHRKCGQIFWSLPSSPFIVGGRRARQWHQPSADYRHSSCLEIHLLFLTTSLDYIFNTSSSF